jgi:tRNA pseudouridine38-40 synthase
MFNQVGKMRYAMKFGYNGKNYSGYARQPNKTTVEGEIITALLKSRIIDGPEVARLRVASRTDARVSACANVLSLSTDFREPEILSALNANLDDIWFYGKARVPEDFNPRHAKERWYRYHIFDEGYDINQMNETAQIFLGTHDFSNFAKVEGNPQRTVNSIEVTKDENLFFLDIKAQSFLWNMVRRIVKAILDVESEKLEIDDLKVALESQEKMDFGIAPPEPLVLMEVSYDFEFEMDTESLGRLKNRFNKTLRRLKLETRLYEHMKNITK